MNSAAPKDLSTCHNPVSDFVAVPKTQQDWEQFHLSDEQVTHFHEQGYVSGVRILSDEQVDQLRTELADLTDPSHPGKELFHEYHSNESTDPNTVLFHALGAWRVKPGFHDMLWSPGFTMAASQLFDGAAVRFWHDQLFCKPPQQGGVVAWHQDYSYWTRTKPIAHLTCWIGLDDTDEENGCLQYIPRSHEWDLLPITGLAGDMDAIKDVLNDEQWEMFNNPVPIRLKKGEAAFHHPLLVHGSKENRSSRPRRATVINAFRDGTKSATDEHLLEGVPVIPPGEQLQGQFFPLLFDPSSN